jgi:hypothetical protein
LLADDFDEDDEEDLAAEALADAANGYIDPLPSEQSSSSKQPATGGTGPPSPPAVSADTRDINAESDEEDDALQASAYEYAPASLAASLSTGPVRSQTMPAVPARPEETFGFESTNPSLVSRIDTLRETVVTEALPAHLLPAYVHQIGRRQADDVLNGKDLGHFLMRYRQEGGMVVSMVVMGSKGPKVSHFRLTRGEMGGYRLQNYRLDVAELDEVVEVLTNQGCAAVTEQAFLTRVDPSSSI